MSELISATEDEKADANGCGSANADGSEGQKSAIDRLFDKMNRAQSAPTEISDESSESAERGLSANPEPSVINRIFERVSSTNTRIDAMPAPNAKNHVTRITHTEIKAMKVLTTTAEMKPDVAVRKQCANSVNALWSDLSRFFHDLFTGNTK
jgi:hypothetical protein